MAWVLAGAALLGFAGWTGRGPLRAAALAALVAGFLYSFQVYPRTDARLLFLGAAAAGAAAGWIMRRRPLSDAAAGALATGLASLLFALFGPADGLF